MIEINANQKCEEHPSFRKTRKRKVITNNATKRKGKCIRTNMHTKSVIFDNNKSPNQHAPDHIIQIAPDQNISKKQFTNLVFDLGFDDDASAYNTPDENNTAQDENSMEAPPLEILNMTNSFVNQVQNNETSTYDTVNPNEAEITGHIASESFLLSFWQASNTQQAYIRDAISTFNAQQANNNLNQQNILRISTDDINSSTPKTNNILSTNQDLLDSSDSEDSIDQSTLIKTLVKSMNDFAQT